MTSLVVILAPSGPIGAVRDVLADLSAVSLVDPFVWVSADSVDQPQVAALSVQGGRASATTLQSIATTQRFDLVRLVVLVPVFAGHAVVPSPVEQQVAQLLENSTGGAQLIRIRAIITRVGDATTTAELGRMGWNNVMLAPEQSAGPSLGHSLLLASDDLIEVGKDAAVAVAGLAGLWSGVAESPFDSQAVDPGESVRIARSFFRRLQSDGLENQLRLRVTGTSDSLPLPVDGGSASVYVEDTSLATGTMAKALWARHESVLKGPRDVRARQAVKAIGFLDALKQFFGFLWAALKNAPQQWYRKMVVTVSSGAARAVHGLVYGENPSAYAVVVGGVTPSGLPASWLDLADAADAIDDLLEEEGEVREHHALSDLSVLWKEYAAGAFTLADGGDRVPGLSPVQIGTQRAVLRTVDLCVPSPSSRFTALPGHIAAQVEIDGVDAYDVLAINNLHARLTYLQRESALGLEVGGALEALQNWNAEHRASYAVRVGSTLGQAIVRTGEEIKELLGKLKAAGAAEDLPAAIAARQKRLALALRIIAILAVVAGAAIGAAYGFGLIEGTLAIILGASALVAWLVGSVVTFLRGQRALFGFLNKRNELVANAEITKRNLRQAVRDLRRLTDAYAQYLAWSRLLGTVLAAPLGTVSLANEDGARLSPDLPLPVRLGSAVVNDESLANAVVALRREIFRTGWLNEPWDALIAAIPRTLGADGYDLRDNPTAIFSQPGSGDLSLLVKWVDIVAERGIDSAVADRLWESVRAQLDGDKKELAEALLGSIVELGQPESMRAPYDTFMSRVDSPEGLSGQFDPAVFAPQARAAASSFVDSSWGRQKRVGLSRVAVLTQLSQGSPPYLFAAASNAVIDNGDREPAGPVF